MLSSMPLYTRFGDAGETQLYGGETTSKTNPRIHAYGTVDELDALLGVIRSEEGCPQELKGILISIQRTLYKLKADLATPGQHIGRAVCICDEEVEHMERLIDDAESKVPALKHFVLPGGTPVSAKLHLARTMCRRAERWVVALAHHERVNFACLRYLNRLGDYLFVLSRVINHEAGVREEEMRADGI